MMGSAGWPAPPSSRMPPTCGGAAQWGLAAVAVGGSPILHDAWSPAAGVGSSVGWGSEGEDGSTPYGLGLRSTLYGSSTAGTSAPASNPSTPASTVHHRPAAVAPPPPPVPEADDEEKDMSVIGTFTRGGSLLPPPPPLASRVSLPPALSAAGAGGTNSSTPTTPPSGGPFGPVGSRPHTTTPPRSAEGNSPTSGSNPNASAGLHISAASASAAIAAAMSGAGCSGSAALAFDEPPLSRLFVHCSASMTPTALHDLFVPYGRIENLKPLVDRRTGAFTGKAFVKYTESAAAKAAKDALHGWPHGHEVMYVQFAQPHMSRGAMGVQHADWDYPAHSRVFVSCSKDMTPLELHEVFVQYGEVEHSTILVEKGTGASRGMGYVKFADAESAARAVTAVNAAPCRRLQCRIAEPHCLHQTKPTRESECGVHPNGLDCATSECGHSALPPGDMEDLARILAGLSVGQYQSLLAALERQGDDGVHAQLNLAHLHALSHSDDLEVIRSNQAAVAAIVRHATAIQVPANTPTTQQPQATANHLSHHAQPHNPHLTTFPQQSGHGVAHAHHHNHGHVHNPPAYHNPAPHTHHHAHHHPHGAHAHGHPVHPVHPPHPHTHNHNHNHGHNHTHVPHAHASQSHGHPVVSHVHHTHTHHHAPTITSTTSPPTHAAHVHHHTAHGIVQHQISPPHIDRTTTPTSLTPATTPVTATRRKEGFPHGSRLFVRMRGVVADEALRETFGRFGEMATAYMVPNRLFGFVQYYDTECAQMALNAQPPIAKIAGVSCMVRPATETRRPRGEEGAIGHAGSDCCGHGCRHCAPSSDFTEQCCCSTGPTVSCGPAVWSCCCSCNHGMPVTSHSPPQPQPQHAPAPHAHGPVHVSHHGHVNVAPHGHAGGNGHIRAQHQPRPDPDHEIAGSHIGGSHAPQHNLHTASLMAHMGARRGSALNTWDESDEEAALGKQLLDMLQNQGDNRTADSH